MKTSRPTRQEAQRGAEHFRSYLRSAFDSRCARNQRYSLRAFARDLDVNQSTLSQILRGRRGLTNRTIEHLGRGLGLNDAIIAGYLAPENGGRALPTARDDERLRLMIDAYDVVADWYHFALLELTRVRGFRPDVRWIARVLGLPVDLVNVAIARLLRLGLLEMTASNRWVDRSGTAELDYGELTEPALKRIRLEAHELAIAAIERNPPALQDHTSITMAISTRKLPEVADLVARFRRDLEELVQENEEPDDVFRIDVAIYPITTLTRASEQPPTHTTEHITKGDLDNGKSDRSLADAHEGS